MENINDDNLNGVINFLKIIKKRVEESNFEDDTKELINSVERILEGLKEDQLASDLRSIILDINNREGDGAISKLNSALLKVEELLQSTNLTTNSARRNWTRKNSKNREERLQITFHQLTRMREECPLRGKMGTWETLKGEVGHYKKCISPKADCANCKVFLKKYKSPENYFSQHGEEEVIEIK
jgi:hypothetical protein